jgi:uncharacterized protein YukE
VPQSFAGITVPEGEPGELRSAAKALTGLSHDLASTAHELDSQPAMLGGWVGPASVTYAGTCQLTSGGVRAGASVLEVASAALRRYGEGLQDAQRDARHAIGRARDAQHRIDRAKRAIAEARARAADARARDAVADSKIALTSVVGVQPPEAVAEQARARSDAAAAELDEHRAQVELEEAQADLARAKAAGARAEEHAREVARAVAAAFDAAGGVPDGDGGGNELPKEIKGTVLGIFHGLIQEIAKKEAKDARYFFPGGNVVPGYWRVLANGQPLRLPHYGEAGTSAAYNSAMQYARRMNGLAAGLKHTGNVLSVVTAGIDQLGDDKGKKLSTTDKAGRVGAASVYKGGASIGAGIAGAEVGAAYGAAFGSAVPIPIVGTVSGAAIGAVIGGVVASGAAGYLADRTKGIPLALGAGAANAAVDGAKGIAKGAKAAAKGAEDLAKGAGKALDSIGLL